MNSTEYLSLNAWLQTADENYIAGRCLWLNGLVAPACNPLWLGLEQMMKILLLQKISRKLAADSDGLDEMHEALDKEGKRLGHSAATLMHKVMSEYSSTNLDQFSDVLYKLNEYFERRYYVRRGSSISLNMLDRVDSLFFLLRRHVHPDVGVGVVDEIAICKKHDWPHPIQFHVLAYLHNQHFTARKHRTTNRLGPDGKNYKEDGTA